ncbi:dihydrofolate reductase family protein [Dietzia sp.]|uniref:dihydrofolate reductase family protein n=1 Tax=Dietzia sp. TaxID=1871616 RepID=UPI002FDA5E74
MGTLSYTAAISVDGFAADADGDFQWTAPGGEVFRFHIERLAKVSTEILGRTTYELMHYWETPPEGEEWGEDEHEFARRWQALDRIVVSTTLGTSDVHGERTRLVDHLELDELRRIVDEAEHEVEIFGPTTAAPAIRAGLVDDFHLLIVPKAVGSGLAAFPADANVDLQLAEQRLFDDGTAYMHYTRK